MSPHNIIALILVTVIKSCNGFSANEEDSIKSYIKTTMECKNITGKLPIYKSCLVYAYNEIKFILM